MRALEKSHCIMSVYHATTFCSLSLMDERMVYKHRSLYLSLCLLDVHGRLLTSSAMWMDLSIVHVTEVVVLLHVLAGKTYTCRIARLKFAMKFASVSEICLEAKSTAALPYLLAFPCHLKLSVPYLLPHSSKSRFPSVPTQWHCTRGGCGIPEWSAWCADAY